MKLESDAVVLIRHGETEGREVKKYKGTIDVPLSEKGMKQMERVSGYHLKTYSGLNRLCCVEYYRVLGEIPGGKINKWNN